MQIWTLKHAMPTEASSRKRRWNRHHDEETVARKAIALAQQAAEVSFSENGRTSNRLVHVGYYLIDRGHEQLEQALGYRPSLRTRSRQWPTRHPTLIYLGSIFMLTLLIVLGVGSYTLSAGASVCQILAACFLALIPGISISVNMVNWILTHTLEPRILPKMDFEQQVPTPYQTMIVIPALLANTEEVEALVQQLELHFLRNPEAGLYFALLADFADAPEQHMEGDEALLDDMSRRINILNARYQRQAGERFYCFVRERRWNPAQNVWMGWERKRGNLSEFNQLLLTGTPGSYMTQVGDMAVLSAIHFVITLDADTVLPKGSALRLIGTLAHPLNHAEFSPDGTQVISGYTILQPRVEVLPAAANRSQFARLFAGDTGIDLYTLAVSDTYQDLFGEGIYVGKGIYDVATFERSLAGRTPENTLLSHDLFEGLHGRAALVTDILLLEDYPAIICSIFAACIVGLEETGSYYPGFCPVFPAEGSRLPSVFSVIDRWKIIDNLRRSLYKPALLLLFAAGWLWLPGSALTWTLLTLLFTLMPLIPNRISQLFQTLRGKPMQQWLLSIAFLPFEALTNLSAIFVTIPRLIRHKNLLQWTSAAHTATTF